MCVDNRIEFINNYLSNGGHIRGIKIFNTNGECLRSDPCLVYGGPAEEALMVAAIFLEREEQVHRITSEELFQVKGIGVMSNKLVDDFLNSEFGNYSVILVEDMKAVKTSVDEIIMAKILIRMAFLDKTILWVGEKEQFHPSFEKYLLKNHCI